MEMNIFGKSVSWQGKTFSTYFTKLVNNATGEIRTFNVKFRQECDQPDIHECPCIIEVPREKMNLQESPIIDRDTKEPVLDDEGNVKISRTIWVSGWEMKGPFIDHALDAWS